MIYRFAFCDDIPQEAFQELVREGLRSGGAKEIDERKLFHFCDWLTGPSHYAALAIDEGRYVAYVAGVVSEHPFLARSVFNIVGWYSRAPGAGLRLMDQCITWARERPYLKHVVITVNTGVDDERLARIFRKRYGAVFMSTSFQIGV